MRFGKLHVDWQALLPITSMVSLSLSAAAGVGLVMGPAVPFLTWSVGLSGVLMALLLLPAAAGAYLFVAGPVVSLLMWGVGWEGVLGV